MLVNENTDVALLIGAFSVAALAAIVSYSLILYSARKQQRVMSTRHRQRRQHWAIRIDDGFKRRRMLKRQAAEKRALQRHRKK